MMKLFINSVKFSIPFMFPDPEDLRREIQDRISLVIQESSEFNSKHGKADLAFIIVLDKKTEDLEVKGPTVDKELVDYAIWLPYKKIKLSENYRIAYLNYLKSGILKVLAKYDFELGHVKEVFSLIEQKEKENAGREDPL